MMLMKGLTQFTFQMYYFYILHNYRFPEILPSQNPIISAFHRLHILMSPLHNPPPKKKKLLSSLNQGHQVQSMLEFSALCRHFFHKKSNKIV